MHNKMLLRAIQFSDLLSHSTLLEVLTPSKVRVGSRSAIFSLPSSGALRVDIAPKDLSTNNDNIKVSLNTIFLTIVCCMFSLNQVECLDMDISSQMTPIQARPCEPMRGSVTNQMTAANWFLQLPTSAFICPEYHYASRQNFAKIDSTEFSPKAFIIANKNVSRPTAEAY